MTTIQQHYNPLRPHVAGPLPGPRPAELLARQERRESNARTYPRHLPVAIESGLGPYVWDVDENVFIDFLSGAGVLSLGRSHPELVATVAEQLGRLTHGLDFPTPAKDAFLDAQLSILPPGLAEKMKVHFCGPAGENAVDAAIKVCKTATGRGDVIAFQCGFHGSSAAAMAVSGLVDQKAPVGNGLPGVHFFPYSYCSRCPLGLDPATCSTNCATYLEMSLKDDHGGIALPAAVILELVQGEGGVVPATYEFVRKARAVTSELDIPLIVDEVQTGGRRTGTWFAFEQYGIEPDVIVASKALSGIGLPVAIIVYNRRLDTWQPGAHTGTFRGNQLAFAAGAATVAIFQRDDVLANVRARGSQIEGLLGVLAGNSWVREVRGRGLMWGVEMADPATGAPAGELARSIQRTALDKGLILECGGRNDAVVRMLPPLNVSAEVVAMACHLLLEAIQERTALAGTAGR
ncbi:diaminobutyrate--2-oxoglutarate transaminase family protein [Pseudarthrobacter sp. P1]|uniref:diaminobutyrate--2-oxoglutarate transaminase family protein n=1 Tax=Pseudarthrobacter sp. P1 TaxID=3418418 RepID=UPI003CEF0C22